LASQGESGSLLSRYGLAAILAGLAALVSFELTPDWIPRHLLLPFYPVVMLSAWFGGFGPGLLTTLLSALAISYLYLPPTPSLRIRDPGDLMGFLLFLCVGLLFSALNARLLTSRHRAESVARDLQREIEERRTVEAVAAKLATVADELQTSVERYRKQLWSLAGVFRARRDGCIVECSNIFVRLLGAASSEQVLALSVKDLLLDPEQWRELAASLTPGAMVSNQELRWQRIDGAPLTVLASIRETDGLLEGVVIDRIADLSAAADEINHPLTVIMANLSPIRVEGEVATRIENALAAARRAQEIVERTTRSNASR